jgi:hypothetical protein
MKKNHWTIIDGKYTAHRAQLNKAFSKDPSKFNVCYIPCPKCRYMMVVSLMNSAEKEWPCIAKDCDARLKMT